jgi:hypothetical protein
MEVFTMFGKNRNKKVGLCVMVVTASLVLAGLWAVLATPETALAHKDPADPGHSHGKGGGGGGKGERTAEVTITGPMQTLGTQTFPIKDSKNTLELNRGVWTDQGAVPLKFNFANTVGAVDNCICKEGNNWDDGVVLDECVLTAHLIDTLPTAPFPDRWGVKIVIDISSLKKVGDFSTTSKKGGHSIDITTDPDQTPTITGTVERLWIPEGPNKSGLVTVEWVSDTSDSETRTRVFKFSQFKIQVVSDRVSSQERKIMRCDNLDGPIEVKVVTPL